MNLFLIRYGRNICFGSRLWDWWVPDCLKVVAQLTADPQVSWVWSRLGLKLDVLGACLSGVGSKHWHAWCDVLTLSSSGRSSKSELPPDSVPQCWVVGFTVRSYLSLFCLLHGDGFFCFVLFFLIYLIRSRFANFFSLLFIFSFPSRRHDSICYCRYSVTLQKGEFMLSLRCHLEPEPNDGARVG